jgi:hypothetical protein
MFFRLILIFIILYLLVKLASGIFVSLFRNPDGSQRKKEGDVHINNNPSKKKKIIKKEDGEYVKYEEIKD